MPVSRIPKPTMVPAGATGGVIRAQGGFGRFFSEPGQAAGFCAVTEFQNIICAPGPHPAGEKRETPARRFSPPERPKTDGTSRPPGPQPTTLGIERQVARLRVGARCHAPVKNDSILEMALFKIPYISTRQTERTRARTHKPRPRIGCSRRALSGVSKKTQGTVEIKHRFAGEAAGIMES